jgi:glucose/arabinose dehydrogenase
MRARSIVSIAIALLAASIAPAQVTHGQRPKLPAPFATSSSGNGPAYKKAPAGFLPTVPAGFKINIFACDFKYPRWMAVAPNGDVFLADSGAGEIIVLRDPMNSGGAQEREVFADGLRRPFGIAFHENYVYVGNMNEVVRFMYDPRTSKKIGAKEHLLDLPTGGHATRSLAFSADGKHLFIGVGSNSNIDTGEAIRTEKMRGCLPQV